MSRCALIIFESGKPSGMVEFSNSWGGSARIWDSLFNAYVPKKHEYDSWIANNGNDQRLWDLAKRKDIPEFECAIHAFTFDRFYVRRENLNRLSHDLRQFAIKYPVDGRVDHLKAWSKWIDENSTVEAVGLWGTSVSENPWERQKDCPHCGNATDETEPIPLNEGIEVYDWLSSIHPTPSPAAPGASPKAQ